MSTKKIGENSAYEQCYHFIASTKYRKNVFQSEEMRTRLLELICGIACELEDTSLLASSVAYNHIHVLIKSDLNPSKVAQKLFGITSRSMRKEFPELRLLNQSSLWGGKSYTPITDEAHLNNCISYINRHKPDNTKA